MKKSRLFGHCIIFSIALLALPAVAAADVQITEIMYDPAGADTGREWVEVTNTGSSAVDIAGFKFFEADTNHGLTLLTGSATLPVGGSAVIVEDQAKFMIDFPSFSGTLFKASFSLSNTGETIATKDSSLTAIDSVSYTSAMGAGGDGNSLQRSGSTFVGGATDPGVFNSGVPSQPSSGTDTTNTNTSAPQLQQVVSSVGGNSPSPITAEITTDSTTVVGSGTLFSGAAFGTQGAPLSDARYIWNFGDGTTAEGQRVMHDYAYPGRYAVVLSVGGERSGTQATMAINVVSAQVSLIAENDLSLLIVSNTRVAIDIGRWILSCGNNTFMIPEQTVLLAGGGIRFSQAITKISCGVGALLRYPNGTTVTQAVLSSDSPLHGVVVSPSELKTVGSSATSKTAPSVAKQTKPTAGTLSSPLAAATVAEEAAALPLSTPVVGLGALLILGVAGALYARTGKASTRLDVTKANDDEFDIES